MAHVKTFPLAALFACVAAAVAAQPQALARRYPDRPLRFIVPFPPGSAPDNIARIMGRK